MVSEDWYRYLLRSRNSHENPKLKELASGKIQTILSIYSVPGTCGGKGKKKKSKAESPGQLIVPLLFGST